MAESDSTAPLIGLAIVIILGMAIVYANVTGMLQVSGTKVVDGDTAAIIVAVLFVLTLPWAWRRYKQES
ncbi:MAG: hypothetical protein R3324_00525 [Halobacteriales archaeon]|nr:hypothetical protein [Halobacteriales archaeon]